MGGYFISISHPLIPTPCACRAQLVARKEEAVEMGGYFICNGIERIIRLLVQQRRHYIMALRRGAYRKRGSNYTDLGTLIRWGLRGVSLRLFDRFRGFTTRGSKQADLSALIRCPLV